MPKGGAPWTCAPPKLDDARPARRPRADALRNRARIVETARDVFAARGADASLEEIARAAGVGIGTLYRHFPTREALVEAVFRDGVEQLQALADELLASDAPGRRARHLAARAARPRRDVPRARGRGDAGDARRERRRAERRAKRCASSGAALLARAQASGDVRAGVDIDDLVRMVQAIRLAAEDSDDPDTAERLFAFMLDGVRPR